MTTYTINEAELKNLKSKTILVTGCSTGIGRATAQIAHANGANLVLGDWNEEAAQDIMQTLGSTSNVLFRKINAANWDDVFDLFQANFEKFGVIDTVISNAGVSTGETLLDEEIDAKTGRLQPPKLDSVNINLIGHLYVIRCANYFFCKEPGKGHQIVIDAAAATFIDAAPMNLYSTCKTGLLGLMRSLKSILIHKNITINIVAPWATATPMVPSFLEKIWDSLPWSQSEDVAVALLLPVVRPEINGKAFFTAGQQIVEFEDTIRQMQPQWMGEQLSKDVEEGQRRLRQAGSLADSKCNTKNPIVRWKSYILILYSQ
ncbi:hypothetical protein N7504_010942 [Penicillium tannophilum]|nr:hypothetical protein N7504_010942 [Penicillium tannophilum]